jgi:hypothetical protein
MNVNSNNLAVKESEIISKIMKDPLVFPKNIIVSELAYKIMQGLMDKNNKTRFDSNDPLFDLWYNEEASDIAIVKQIEEPVETPTIKIIHKETTTKKTKAVPKTVTKMKVVSKNK